MYVAKVNGKDVFFPDKEALVAAGKGFPNLVVDVREVGLTPSKIDIKAEIEAVDAEKDRRRACRVLGEFLGMCKKVGLNPPGFWLDSLKKQISWVDNFHSSNDTEKE